MTSPVELLGSIVKVAVVISEKINEVKSFPSEAEDLGGRIEDLTGAVEMLYQADAKVIENVTYTKALTRMDKLLNKVKDFIFKLSEVEVFVQWLRSGHYVQKFNTYNTKLDRVGSDLQLVIKAVEISTENQRPLLRSKWDTLGHASNVVNDIRAMVEFVEGLERKMSAPARSKPYEADIRVTLTKVRSNADALVQYTIYQLVTPWLGAGVGDAERSRMGVRREESGQVVITLPPQPYGPTPTGGKYLEPDAPGDGDTDIEDEDEDTGKIEAEEIAAIRNGFKKLRSEAESAGDQELVDILDNVC